MSYDPIKLEVFKHRFSSIAEEMGVVLRLASYSPNIKERRDYSCALFNAHGVMVAQAAHIPVHLGSMPLSVASAIQHFLHQDNKMFEKHPEGLKPGDSIILNDPFSGGTHLPDITLITPIFLNSGSNNPDHRNTSRLEDIPSRLYGFVACRAHHADVGGITPGSMPVAREIYQEGLIIPPIKLFETGRVNQNVMDLILSNVRTPIERAGDLLAQNAANQRGVARIQELVSECREEEVSYYMDELVAYTERMTRRLLEDLPNGEYRFTDFLDNDGVRDHPIPITVTITISGDSAIIDFTGSADQQKGSINAVLAITLSAVYYVFRCMIGLDAPNNAGCLAPIKVIAPPGTIVNAYHPAPVAGGNVETSQRIVDVLLGALAKATPERVPAASQGTMNNVTIGGYDHGKITPFTYYETIGGGMGALPYKDGPSAVHSHMTNTLNTPVEALEYAYPLRVIRYEVRRDSGGKGRYRGGDGIRRDVQVLTESHITLLSERRKLPPYGLAGGEPGSMGENILIRNNREHPLPGKGTFDLQYGDILSIRTPGGGGYGEV